MKKLLMALAACATTLLASAAIKTQVDFESGLGAFDGTGGESEAVAYDTAPSPSLANYPFADEGSNYCAIDADENDPLSSPSVTDAAYFDMYVQFPENAGDPSANLTGAKLAVFVDTATSKLAVIAGNGTGGVVTNVTETSITLGEWTRLTIAKDVTGYNVYKNKNLVQGSPFAPIPTESGDFLGQVQFTGSGKLDNFVARTTDPISHPEGYVAKVGGDDGEYYETLAAALADGYTTLTEFKYTFKTKTGEAYDAETNPYVIADVEDLLALMYGGNLAASYVQTNNIDMSGVAPFPGIGTYAANLNSGVAFTGTYDGQGYKISNIDFTQRNYGGVFNQVKGGTIKNLTVDTITCSTFDSSVNSGEWGCAIVGNAGLGATLKNLTAMGSFGSSEKPCTHNVAGIAIRVCGGASNVVNGVTMFETLVQNCTNNATLYGSYTKCAGISALTQDQNGVPNDYVLFDGCVNNANIAMVAGKGTEGRDGLSGILGYVADGTKIQNCENKGTLTSVLATAKIGGIVGWAQGRTLDDLGGNVNAASAKMVGDPSGSTITGFQYATVDNGVATTIAPPYTLAADNTYLLEGNVAAGTVYTFDAAGTIAFNTNGYNFAGTVAVANPNMLDVETSTVDETVTYTAVGGTAVAQITKGEPETTTQYNTLAKAIDAAAAGDTITLVADSSEAVTVNKAITFVEGENATFSGTFDGSGTVAMTVRPKAYVYTGAANGGTLFASTWTGTFDICWNPGNACFVLDDFGNAYSAVKITGENGSFGAFPSTFWVGSTFGAPSIAPAIELACTWTIANGWTGTTTAFSKLSGTGDLAIQNTTYARSYSISTLDGYSGTISTGKHNVRFGNIVKAGAAFDVCLVKAGTTFTCDLTSSQVNGAAATLAVGTVNDQKGIYLARASVNGAGYVTVAEAITAAETACANTVAVLDGTSVAYQGWTFENGVYTYASYRAKIGETGYPTLSAAVAAAGENEVTIDLVDHIWEDVTVPANVTVAVADDVQIRGGTLSGAGRFVYTKVPNQFRFTFNNWTGTVTLNYAGIVSGGDLANQIVAYGDANSVVEIGPNGTVTGNSHLNSDLKTTLMVNGYVSINNGASATKRFFPRVTGGGVLVFGNKGAMVNYDVQELVDWTGVITNNASNVLVTNIVSGTGAVVFNVAAPAVNVGASFEGSVVYNVAPNQAPVVDADSEATVYLNFNYAGMNIAPYGNAKSTIKLGNLSAGNAYINDGSGSGTGKIPSKVVVAGGVTINNGWTQYPGFDWTGSKTVQFDDFTVDGSFSLVSAQTWNSAYCYYYVKSLNGDGAGTITVGQGYSLRIDAVDFAEAPSGSDRIVPLVVAADTSGSNPDGQLYGANGVLNGAIPVTTNGVATGQSLVYDAAKGGLVLYVAPSGGFDPSKGDTEVTVEIEDEGKTKEQIEAAVIAEAAAKVTVPSAQGADPVSGATYLGYFKTTVTGENGAYTLTLNGLKDEVYEEAKTDAIKALLDSTKNTIKIPAGLYYKITPSADLTTWGTAASALSTGSVTAPATGGTGKGFYKVELSATPID